MVKPSYLSDYKVQFTPFAHADEELRHLHTHSFTSLQNRQKFKRINKILLQLIQNEPTPCFLLPATLDFIAKVNASNLLSEEYLFSSFEFWLNHFSNLSLNEQLLVRGKIAGRYIPRDEYQTFFPIGMNTYFPGSHFVAAHASPDVDTTVASLWGWIDAFSAKVGTSNHIWSLPGSFEEAHVKLLFQKLFSDSVFSQLARSTPTLTMTAMDLVTTKDVIKVHADTPTSQIDHNTHHNKAVILVDDHGYYLGDWRASDAENARQVAMLFYSVIRWFESTLHSRLISIFSKSALHLDDVTATLEQIFEIEVRNYEPVKEFTDKQRRHLNDYLKKVLHISRGIHSSFKELGAALDLVAESEFKTFKATLDLLRSPDLFDKSGMIIEDRPAIFSRLETVFSRLEETISAITSYTDRLRVMTEIQTKVLGHPPQFVMLKSDVDEIRSKLEDLSYLTVVVPEDNGLWFPVGIVHSSDLRKALLGTVSMRDFSNPGETKMASYLEVISVIDHHKTDLKTSSAPLFHISDAQSTNSVIAAKNYTLNRIYGSMGIQEKACDQEIEKTKKLATTPDTLKRLQRLADIKMSYASPYFVHPQREFAEYLCYLYAILDDTDLLSKVSKKDVQALSLFLNRMKSITATNDEEIISLDDIPMDAYFAKNAARRILQNQDMYSLYKQIYEFKEQEVAANLRACIAKKPSTVFADTKEQNGCCRVGQTKLFQKNFSLFSESAMALRSIWYQKAQETYQAKHQIDFHMHMISTIPGAEEVYAGEPLSWTHRDEMWLWVAPTQKAMERLIYFLNAFHTTPAVQNNDMKAVFFGDNWHELQQAFEHNFPAATCAPAHDAKTEKLPIAVLYFKPGTINSRKAMITPYLPRFVS